MKRLILMTAALGTMACGGADEPGRLPMTAEPVAVTVSTARHAPSVESFPAVVTSERTAEIATRMSGTVERVLVDVGARVRRGDVLIELDARDVEARVSAARAQEQLAERSHTRIDNLARDGAASQQELDQATAQLEAARAMRAEAEAQRAYAVVRAPFDGVVTRREIDPGDLAMPGMPFITVMAPGALKVEADLPARTRRRAGSRTDGPRARRRRRTRGEDHPRGAGAGRGEPHLPGGGRLRGDAVRGAPRDLRAPGGGACRRGSAMDPRRRGGRPWSAHRRLRGGG